MLSLYTEVSTQVKRVLIKEKGGDGMALSDRKIQILQAIINDYIETAEPVGSRTIAKKYKVSALQRFGMK